MWRFNCVNPVGNPHVYFYVRRGGVKAACICQTLHFMLKDDLGHDYAVKLVKEEVEKYKASLDKNRTKYKIVSEETQSDGSVMIKIIKQYNTSPVGDYLD